MNDRLKKMIAREGLVLIGIVILGLSVIAINTLCNAIFVKNYVYSLEEKGLGFQIISYAHYDMINTVGLFISLFGYLTYLLVKYIGWAIKTVKQK